MMEALRTVFVGLSHVMADPFLRIFSTLYIVNYKTVITSLIIQRSIFVHI